MVKYPIKSKTEVVVLNVIFKGTRDAKMLRMVLDSGATLTTIPSEIALAIGCDPTKSKRKIEMITASGKEFVSIVTVSRIVFLGFTLTNVDVACLDLPPGAMVSGLLGINVLKEFKLVLDFPKGILEITK